MKKNSIKKEQSSIEEDIILLKDFTEGNFKRDKLENYKGSYKMGYFYYKDIQQAIEHILSDYKTVLKETELLRKDIEDWKKYCEEIQEEQTEMSNKNCELEFEVEKLQKENEKYKRLAKINLKNAEEFKDNMCEHRCLLKSENEELKEDFKYVLNQTLKAFKKNWCIDWNFTEIREKYNLESE